MQHFHSMEAGAAAVVSFLNCTFIVYRRGWFRQESTANFQMPIIGLSLRPLLDGKKI